MGCNKIDTSLLQEFLEGTIDPLERIFLENHLKMCVECRRELSELKLLFFDLNYRSNYETDLPTELDTIRDGLIDTFLGKSKRTSKKLLELQIDSIKMTGKFIEYLPGTKQAPKVIKQVSKGLRKGVKKLIAK